MGTASCSTPRCTPTTERPAHPNPPTPRLGSTLNPSDSAPVVLADEHTPRRHRLGCLISALVVSALVVSLTYIAVQWFRGGVDLGGQLCRATSGEETVSLSPEQMDNAATIVGIAMGRGMPARAGTIAVATAIQESKLRNINYGDRDSLGLFQQRPSQGWGTEDEILDPVYSTNTFYDALLTVEDWENGVVTEVAQEVQRSAFPDAYGDHETEGRVLASTLSGHTTASMVCRLDAPTWHTEVDDVQADLRQHLGIESTLSQDGQTLTVQTGDERQAWSVGQYLVAKAERHAITTVVVGDDRWVRSSGPSALVWAAAGENAAAEPTVVVATLTQAG